jgi:hypothetical protein
LNWRELQLEIMGAILTEPIAQNATLVKIVTAGYYKIRGGERLERTDVQQI